MQSIDGRPVYAATDLVAYLACEHLTQLERAALAGLVKRPMRDDPSSTSSAKRGFEHEARFLADLEAAGRRRSTISSTARSRTTASGCAPRPPRPSRRWPRGGRHLPGDLLRRDLARPRRLPAARRRPRTARRAGARTTTRSPTRSWPATSRRARSSRSARTSTSSSASRASARVAARRARWQRADRGAAAGRRLHGLLPGRQGPSSSHAVADATPRRLPAARHVPRAGRALRRLPLGGGMRRSGAPTTT